MAYQTVCRFRPCTFFSNVRSDTQYFQFNCMNWNKPKNCTLYAQCTTYWLVYIFTCMSSRQVLPVGQTLTYTYWYYFICYSLIRIDKLFYRSQFYSNNVIVIAFYFIITIILHFDECLPMQNRVHMHSVCVCVCVYVCIQKRCVRCAEMLSLQHAALRHGQLWKYGPRYL